MLLYLLSLYYDVVTVRKNLGSTSTRKDWPQGFSLLSLFFNSQFAITRFAGLLTNLVDFVSSGGQHNLSGKIWAALPRDR